MRDQRRASHAIFDVVVIGGGIAGWTAARRTQHLGANVALIERSPGGPGWSNSLLSGARIHAVYKDPRKRSPAELYDLLRKKTDGHARPDVAKAWSENTGRAVDFLLSEGAEIGPNGPFEYMQNALQPGPAAAARNDDVSSPDFWKDRGSDRLLHRMWKAFVDDGGTFTPGSRAVELSMKDGAVVGVHIEKSGGGRELVRGRAVIMADGGFQANRELMAKYGVARHTYRLQGSENDVGDCLQMAIAIGAKIVDMDTFYANLELRDTVTNPRLLRAPRPTQLIDASIVVNGRGERLGDEALGTDEWALIDVPLANPVAKNDAPGDSWVVFDDAVWETAGRDPGGARRNASNPARTLNPLLLERGGTVLAANSIAELALQAGLPPDRLQRTVDDFNRFRRDGTPLEPLRSGHPPPIAQPPFHAIPIVAGVFFTLGGVLVNAGCQVLDTRERPIPGLYAIGGTMGGLGGGPNNGYAGGWSEASTSGLLAAEHAVSQARSPSTARA